MRYERPSRRQNRLVGHEGSASCGFTDTGQVRSGATGGYAMRASWIADRSVANAPPPVRIEPARSPLKHALLQLDNFATDIAQVREAVVTGEFSTETGPDGATYTGISKHQVPHWFELISQAIERPIIPRLSFFRLNLAGELPHSWVHSDDICARFAGILYLNPPQQCRGGTAFWRHTGLRLESMPSLEDMHATATNVDWFLAMMNREWKDLTFWEQSGFVAMAFNRFISYPTSRFHSRYPFEGFGTGPCDGRLLWTCFFDVA